MPTFNFNISDKSKKVIEEKIRIDNNFYNKEEIDTLLNNKNKELIDSLYKNEIYKSIPNTDCFITNIGRVFRLCKLYKRSDGHNSIIYAKFLATNIDKGGYRYITIKVNNKNYKSFKIHRLVANAFIDNPNNYPCINHKDENKENNNVDNLEWCDVKYNNGYGTRLENISKNTASVAIDVYKRIDYDKWEYVETVVGINVCSKKYNKSVHAIYDDLKNKPKKFIRKDKTHLFKLHET